MKPKLCRSSWKAFASTHPLLLSSTSLREALFACPSLPRWNLPSFTVESTPLHALALDLPLSRQDTTLAHLDTLPRYDLVLWTDSSVPLPFDKGGSGVLANCSLCSTDATLSFSAGPVCSSFSAKACAILQALGWSQQHQQVCHFSSIFLHLTLALSSPPCPLLHLSFYLNLSGRNCLLSPILSGYNGSLDTRFSRGTTWLMSWPNGKHYLRPLQSLVVSLLLSLVSTLFSNWRRTVSSKFFDTQVPSISTKELALPRHARCVLSRLRCNGRSLLLSSYLSRNGRIENPSCSACGHPSQDTSRLILHCPATDSLRHSLFGDSLPLYDLWSRP